MLKKWSMRHKYTVIFILFLVCFFGYNISKAYGFIFFPDEFGYWAYAAKAAGYDWSEMVSLGSYYSYGYSLILFPIFKLCKDSVMAYRVAVTLNFILLGATFFMLLSVAKNILKGAEHTALFAAVAVFYPSWLFYAKTTMVETVLMTLFVMISALLYCYLEKNKLSTLAILVVALVYIHFLHMRAIGITIAGILTLLLYFLLQSGKMKQFLITVGIGMVVLLGGFAIKEVMQNLLYTSTSAETLHINDYAGQLEKVFYIFSKEGMINFVCGLVGKVLYLGLSSFGLAYWGIWYAMKEVWSLGKQIKKGTERDIRKLFFVFILLATVGETLINTIFNIRPIRVDSVTYGRYHEFVLPILMLLGLYEMTKTKKLFIGTMIVIFIQLPMVPMVTYCVERYQLTNFHGYIMVGMSYLHGTESVEPTGFFWMTYVLLSGLTMITALVAAMARKKNREVLLILLIVLEFVLSVRASSLYIDASSLGAYRDTMLVTKIERLQAENKDRRVIYIQEDDSPFISIMQFMMRDTKIEMLDKKAQIEEYTDDEMDLDDIIALKYDSTYTEEAAKKYNTHLLNGHFVIYYNP